MTPYFSDPHLTVYLGDCREVLASLEPESVHCVVTSPPYWGLRDYGTARWEGDLEGCDHTMPVSYKSSTLGASSGGRSVETHQRNIEAQATPYRERCAKCGARRVDGQLGLEPTPEAYVEAIVGVFRDVRRVLRRDGTVWLNLGDSYAGSGKGAWDRNDIQKEVYVPGVTGAKIATTTPGLKPKDLVGIPWRVAFALQADGWYLRSDIIWAKPNPMPESVTDRPTKSHEYVFLLSKSARYWYDADAVREEHVRIWDPAAPNGSINARTRDAMGIVPNPLGRNLRSVWTIATQPYPGAHFATFPEALVEPCVKAGCPEGGTVLDPFAGSGTTGLVANRLGRRAVLIDLSAEYLGQVMERNAQAPLGLGA